MDGPWLTADIGNSHCKVWLWSLDGRVLVRGAFDTCAARAPALDAFLDAQAPPARGLLSSVASDVDRGRWEDLLAARCETWLGTPPHGLVNRCEPAQSVGLDRLFAARGAVDLAARSCLVLDAGTALTVDAVRVRGEAEPAEFLGGAIAPGPELLARALAQGGAQLPSVEPKPDADALGRDTLSALQAGIGVGFQGAARELARRIAAEADLPPDHAILLTGGARAFLSAPGLFASPPEAIEGLVHHGLLAAGRAAAGSG